MRAHAGQTARHRASVRRMSVMMEMPSPLGAHVGNRRDTPRGPKLGTSQRFLAHHDSRGFASFRAAMWSSPHQSLYRVSRLSGGPFADLPNKRSIKFPCTKYTLIAVDDFGAEAPPWGMLDASVFGAFRGDDQNGTVSCLERAPANRRRELL
jgi:hypothetical protein